MQKDAPDRDLRRLRWIGILAPVAFVWIFELARSLVLDNVTNQDLAHVVSALIMAGGVVAFAILMSAFLDRTQRRLVQQNRDMMAMTGVSQEVRGGTSHDETLRAAVAHMVHQTDALAGLVRIDRDGATPRVVRHPEQLPGGLAWVAALLDEPAPVHREPRFHEHGAIDAAVLDVPLIAGDVPIGLLRLAYHPIVRPELSDAALLDIGGELATAAQLTAAMADLRRSEAETAALYQVALQLTGRAQLDHTLDTITHHARELLHADRAVVCLAAGRAGARAAVPGRGGDATVQGGIRPERFGDPDDSCACLIGHAAVPPGTGQATARNEACPLHARREHVAFLAQPLRGPDAPLGELCVARADGRPFTEPEVSLLSALADLAAVAVRTAQLRDAEGQWIILSERDRIARELHDSIAQVLGVLHLRLWALSSSAGAAGGSPGGLGSGSVSIVAQLDELADIADEAYRDVREAILGLRETVHGETGLAGALADYIAKYGRQTGITTRLIVEDQEATRFEPRVEVQLLRVVQEALTNVRKHAHAATAVVRLAREGGVTVLSIEDDGVGFDPQGADRGFSGGFGMTSMRERVEQVGGTLELHTAQGEGTRIVVRLGAEGGRVTHPAALEDRAGR